MSQNQLAAPAAALLTEAQVAAIREELTEQRQIRLEQVQAMTADATAAGSSSDGRVQVTRVLALAAEAALNEIDAALSRLDDDCFGSCERCAEAILPERLEVLPTSRLCTPCQYQAEADRTGRPRRNSRPVAVAAGRAAPRLM